MSDKPLWTPSAERVAGTQVAAFMREVNKRHGTSLGSYAALHQWSVEHPAEFWSLVWDFCGVVGDKGAALLTDANRMPGAGFFPEARLNFAENLLKHAGRPGDAMVFRGEDKRQTRMTWSALAALVSRLQQAMAGAGVTQGDRVAAMMPNLPETVALMLATTSLGAIWSSCSPD
ncbi:MAG: AMP-binding protein, partial [Pseudorhodoplanes sp.]